MVPRILVHSIITALLAWIFLAVDQAAAYDTTIEELRVIQHQIQQIVGDRLPAVVAVSDGVGFGSGAVVSPSGLILTAGHVISTGKSEFDVYFPDGRIVRARLLGYNLDVDAGMLQLTEKGPWPYVPVADSSQHLAAGDWLVSLGHSGGYEVGRKPPVRSGRLLERRRHLLVTDAVLIGGDSGGPLFDLQGRLVAIHSSIGDSIAENRHVAIDEFQRDWQQLVSGRRWGRLPELASDESGDGQEREENRNSQSAFEIQLLGVAISDGQGSAKIERVMPNTPAARVGIKVGDAIQTVDGKAVKSAADGAALLGEKRPGQSVALTVLRNGRALNLQIILDRLN